MRVVILACLVAIGFGLNAQMQCFPPSCKIDANCVDNIHYLGNAKCCGGVCTLVSSLPTNRGVGETCMASSPTDSTNFYESCGGTCGTGLFCSEADGRCHLQLAHGCNCTKNSECAQNRCRSNVAGVQTVCSAYQSIPNGGACDASDQCVSGRCAEGTCASLNHGDVCTFGTTACGPASYCRLNYTNFQYTCFTRCAAGVADCCDSSSDCQATLTCTTSNGTCYLPPTVAPEYADLGATCSFSVQCRNLTEQVCASACNATFIPSNPCPYSTTICQLKNSFSIGSPCSVGAQCPMNSSCVSNSSIDVCTAHRTIPTGQYCSSDIMCVAGNLCLRNATSYMCAPNGTVALDGPCYSDPRWCAAPANRCGSNGGVTQVCRANGTIAIGAFCTVVNPEECVAGAECVSNACRAKKEPYENCTSSGAPYCKYGINTCVVSRWDSTDSCFYTGNCYCTIPQVVRDGEACNATIQCQSNFSTCVKGKCTPVAGTDCDTVGDCGSGYPTFDCNCDRKCYILNNPTPAPTPYPTSPPSPPTPGRCDAKRDLWHTNEPAGWNWPIFEGYITSSYFQCPSCSSGYDFVERARVLNATAQAALIDFVCCTSCGGSYGRFYSQLANGYQVDCNAKTLTKLPDTCNSLRNSPAFLGCWASTVSSAPTSTLGLGALIFAALLY